MKVRRRTVAAGAAGLVAAACAVALLAAAAAMAAATVAVLGNRWVKHRRDSGLGDPVAMALEKTRHAVEWAEARRREGDSGSAGG